MQGGHHQERGFLDLGRLRRVLDELNQFILEHDRSGRYREVTAYLKCGFVDPGDAPFLEILDQVLHPGARLAERVRMAVRMTSGFVAGKFDGLIASMNWRA